MNTDLLLVLNPCAGQMRANRLLPQIAQIMWNAGYRCVLYVTKCEGDAAEYVAAHASEYARIVCIGGDGTLNETISGTMQSGVKVPIGYIPAGSTNDYAASIGLSANIEEAADDAVNGILTAFDMGNFNGRSFTYTASCGAFARVSYATPQKLKNALGHLAYVLSGITDLSSIRPYRLKIETDDAMYDEDFVFCAVTNSSSVGGILKLDVDLETLRDGFFEVLLVRNPTNPFQLSAILNGIVTRDMSCEMFYFIRTKSLRVTSEEEIEWTLDGERADAVTEAYIENRHHAVSIVIPQRAVEHED